MHVVITGANGFIGSRLVQRLLAAPAFAGARLTLSDTALPYAPRDARVRAVLGDLCDAAVRKDVLGDGADMAFHLAGILGGAAEANYDLARRVNVDATLSLFEALRRPDRPPRVVFASSIAVFGAPMPSAVDDDTVPRPTMTYGAQKLMMENALAQFSARGWIDGLAIRLPGIVAREDADARMRAAFLNLVFYAVRDGRDFIMPVSPGGATWLISVPACVDAFIHAATVDTKSLGSRRALTLPAQRVHVEHLIAALKQRFPASKSNITFAPDAALEAQFAAYPPLATPKADALGFRHDGDVATIVQRAMEMS